MTEQNRPNAPSDVIYGFGVILDCLSGEYLLTQVRYPNGGTVVFLRALHVTLLIFLGTLACVNILDSARGYEFSWGELGAQVLDHITWIGAIFAAAYALLYARFASQWTYLAGVYNQIKAAQLRDPLNVDVLAEWQAGFIEDCDDLHLIRKPMFASIAKEWMCGNNNQVVKNLNEHSPGGEIRQKRIAKEVEAVVALIDKRYNP